MRAQVLERLGLGRGLGEGAERLAGHLHAGAALDHALPARVDLAVDGSRRQRAHGEHVALAAQHLREVRRSLGRGEVVVAVDVDRAVDGHRAQQRDGRDARVGRLLHRAVERVRRGRLEDDQVRLLLDEAVVLLQLLGDVEVAARGADLHLPHALRVGEVLLEVVDELDLEVADQLAPGHRDGVRAGMRGLPVRPAALEDLDGRSREVGVAAERVLVLLVERRRSRRRGRRAPSRV